MIVPAGDNRGREGVREIGNPRTSGPGVPRGMRIRTGVGDPGVRSSPVSQDKADGVETNI